MKQPILGADFLSKHKLIVDLHNRLLIDNTTKLSTQASRVHFTESSLTTIDVTNPYSNLLELFPDITRPVSFKETPRHRVYHHIETTGPPVHARVRPLPPDRYIQVRDEFNKMCELGICRPSKSAWSVHYT